MNQETSPAPPSSLSPGVFEVIRKPALLSRETLAGIVTALALIPEVISFSVVAGVDPQVSLIASVVICLTLSLIGGRPAMVSAAAGSVALVIAPLVHQQGIAYLLPTVVLAGLLQIALSLSGMTRMMRYIPRSVMTGFVNALGLLIFYAQVPHVWAQAPLVWGMFAVTLAIVLLLPRLFSAIPAPLIAIVVITAAAWSLGYRVPTVGDEGPMSAGLPGLTQLQVPLNLHTLAIIWPTAVSVALVGLIETLLTAKMVDDLTDTHSSKAKEAVGLGIANILAAFYGGIAGCAMIGQTVVNVELGKARSRLSTLVAGIVLLLLVSVLSQVMAHIPMVVLAAIMMVVAVKTLNWHSVRPATLRRLPLSETLIMLATVVITVSTSNLALGVVSGVVLAILWFARRISHVITTERDVSADGKTATYHVRGTLFFASSNDLYEHFEYATDPSQVIIDLSSAVVWDTSSVAALDAIEQRYQRYHTQVTLTGLHGPSKSLHQQVSGQLD